MTSKPGQKVDEAFNAKLAETPLLSEHYHPAGLPSVIPASPHSFGQGIDSEIPHPLAPEPFRLREAYGPCTFFSNGMNSCSVVMRQSSGYRLRSEPLTICTTNPFHSRPQVTGASLPHRSRKIRGVLRGNSLRYFRQPEVSWKDSS